MDRKEFIKTCGFACLGATTIGMLLQSCTTTKSVTKTIAQDKIIVPISDFEQVKNGTTTYRKHIVVNNNQLQFPIYLFRVSATEYKALYMKCTHQGQAVSASGDKLVCSAHGSVFDHSGAVVKGPADAPLRSFPTIISPKQITISLKKV